MTTTEKETAYEALIAERKKFDFSDKELSNPFVTDFDINEIEPWAQWQNNLDAEILLIGQEFCSLDKYNDVKGTVELFPDKYEYANGFLNKLFKILGNKYDIGHPHPHSKDRKSAPVFMTNAVMGLKTGSMSSNFKDKWLKESREKFLKPLIEIIQPKIIITLGSKALLTISKCYDFNYKPLKYSIDANPVFKNESVKICSVYHPGKLGLISRKEHEQLNDWANIKKIMND